MIEKPETTPETSDRVRLEREVGREPVSITDEFNPYWLEWRRCCPNASGNASYIYWISARWRESGLQSGDERFLPWLKSWVADHIGDATELMGRCEP